MLMTTHSDEFTVVIVYTLTSQQHWEIRILIVCSCRHVIGIWSSFLCANNMCGHMTGAGMVHRARLGVCPVLLGLYVHLCSCVDVLWCVRHLGLAIATNRAVWLSI